MRDGIFKPSGKRRAQVGGSRHRIVYCGNFKPYFSTENDYRKSFEALGYKVIIFQESDLREELIGEVLKACESADFLLYTRTWADKGGIWNKINRQSPIPTVSVHLDLYIGINREEGLAWDPFFLSDYVFSADGGHQDKFAELGINHFFLPPGVLAESCYRGKKVDRFCQDVIFCGSYKYHAEWDYRPLLINWLRNTFGSRFKLYGSGEVIRGDDLNNLYESVKVIVGDSLYSPNYWSDRVPETLGRGGFLIHPRVPGMEKQFTPYKHFIPYEYGDFKTLKEIIDYYIEHDDEREPIKQAAFEYVKENHTYKNLAQKIIKTLQENGAIGI
jgi:hypothetical protein